MVNRMVERIVFDTLDDDDIRQMSVCRVSNKQAWNDKVDAPVSAGPLDYQMGFSTPSVRDAQGRPLPCDTCGGVALSSTVYSYAQRLDSADYDCVGHFGHIELPLPVYTPMTLQPLVYLLRSLCFWCGQSLVHGVNRGRTMMAASKCSDATAAVQAMAQSAKSYCRHCQKMQPRFTLQSRGGAPPRRLRGMDASEWFHIHARFDRDDVRTKVDETPAHLRQTTFVVCGSRAKSVLVRALACNALVDAWQRLPCFGSRERLVHYFNSMLLTCVPVLPPPSRPSERDRYTGLLSMHFLTERYSLIVQTANKLTRVLTSSDVAALTSFIDTSHAWHLALDDYAPLQHHIMALMDVSAATHPPNGALIGPKGDPKSLATNMRGKEGRFRGNLMGKRSNFTARTVLTPDPNLSFNELGVPRSVAQQLTVPERVSTLNREALEKLCEVVVDSDKSVRAIFDEDGLSQRSLARSPYSVAEHGHLRIGQIVERPLRNGDIVVLNRQPTLHRLSMQAMRIRILPHSTFRIGLSRMPPFNADCDGDEVRRRRRRRRRLTRPSRAQSS